MGKTQKVLVNGELYEIEILERTREQVRFNLDGRSYEVKFENSVPSTDLNRKDINNKLKQTAGGVKNPVRTDSQLNSERNIGEIIAPIPGLIIEILVKVGDIVVAGDLVAKLEAMKMQNNIYCATSGKVTEILVTVGDEVSDRTLLLKISPE